MGFFGKIPFFVKAIIVIIAVSAFALVDPTGLLSSRKLTLKNTPVSIKSVRSIGKLISAEYYGETLASLQEAKTETLAESIDNFFAKEEIVELNKEFLSALTWMNARADEYKWPEIRNKIKRDFYGNYSNITQNFNYPEYLNFMLLSAAKTWPNQKIEDEKDLLRFLVKEEASKIEICRQFIKDTSKQTSFKADATNQLTADKKFQKKQLVMIGRGTVQAGIDFGSFNENNFEYSEETKTVYLMGLSPQIIDTVMNPWFIPKLKIRGFEILFSSKKASNPKEVTELKTRLKNQLVNQAMERDILERARENAEQNLKAFFSLVMDEEIANVVILDNNLQQYMDIILSDGTLSGEELILIDTLLTTTFDRNQTISRAVLDSLRKSKRLTDEERVYRFSGTYQYITDNSILDNEEKGLLLRLKREVAARNLTKLDSCWYWPNDSSLSRLNKMAIAEIPYLKDASTLKYIQLKMDSIRKSEGYMNVVSKRDKFKSKQIMDYMLKQKDNDYLKLVADLKAYEFDYMTTESLPDTSQVNIRRYLNGLSNTNASD